MLVEAGLESLALVFLLRPAGQREQPDAPTVGPGPDAPSDLVAVHLGQADVEQDDVRPEALDGPKRFARAVGGGDVVAFELEDEVQARSSVAIVVDDEHTPCGPRANGLFRLGGLRTARRERQADDELAPLA